MWLTIVIVFALFCAAMSQVAYRPQVPEIDSGIRAASEVQENLSLSEQQQIAALTMKLADLQSNILRLNALGKRLANEAEIPEQEFSFETTPPTGGPTLDLDSFGDLSLTSVTAQIAALTNDVSTNEKQLKILESISLGHHIDDNSYLSGRPIKKGWLSSYYGMRKDPFTGKPALHKGIDFAGVEGEHVLATGSGVVSWAGERYGYGNLVEIEHGAGFKTRYGHNKTLLVKVGDVVEKNQPIAEMGNTGRSTGAHVHYEILKGNEQINPIKFVYRKAKND